MKFILTLFILFLLLPHSVFSQKTFLSGNIADKKTNQPIVGAVVSFSSKYKTVTDSSGSYKFASLSKGMYTLRISRIGYSPFVDTIFINGLNLQRDFQLEPSLIEFDEVPVISSRLDGPLRNSPLPLINVASNLLQAKPFQSLSDALSEQPGISVLHDGVWGTDISLRGLSRENVVTLIDGNRISTSTDVAARLSMISLSDIDRVEIIKGASSSLYGTGAVGGIVNIITKEPNFQNEFSAKKLFSASVSSVNRLSSYGAGVNFESRQWTSKLSGSFRKAGNTSTPSGELLNSQFKDYSVSSEMKIAPLDNHMAFLGYQMFRGDNIGIPGTSVFPGKADVRYPYEKREMALAGYEIKNISSLLSNLKVSYSFQKINREVENIPYVTQLVAATPSSPAKRVSVTKITPGAIHKSNNLLLQGNVSVSKTDILAVGIDYWDRTYDGHREKYQQIDVLDSLGKVKATTYKVIGEKPLPDSKFNSLGIFAQNDLPLYDEKLSLTFGGRIDRNTFSGSTTLNPIYEIVNGVQNDKPVGQQILWNGMSKKETSYSGNVGMNYALTASCNLTLNAAYAFRSPSLEERFQYIDQGTYVRVGNPYLNPERSKSIDLGGKYYSSRIKIISNVYFNYFNDLVLEVPGTFLGKTAFIKTNTGRARIYGFEFLSEYNFYQEMLLRFTAAFTRGEDISNEGNLPLIPPLNSIVALKSPLFESVNYEISVLLYAAQKNIAPAELATPGYATINLALSSAALRWAGSAIQLSAGVENILNKDYRAHLSSTRGLIKSEPGRNIYLTLTLQDE